jgi:hypothetical protein
MLGYAPGFNVDTSGYQLTAAYPNVDLPVEFLDHDFRDPDYESLVEAIHRHEPASAVVGDAADAQIAKDLQARVHDLETEYPDLDAIITVKSADAFGSIDQSTVIGWPNEYADIDRPLWEAIEQGRFSTDEMDSLMVDTQKIPSTFANLATVRGNTAFASAGGVDFSRHNFKWKHERVSEFNTIDDLTVYNIGQFVDEDGDVHEPQPPRHLSSGNQGRGGSVGVSFRYTSNVKLTNSTLINNGLEN